MSIRGATAIEYAVMLVLVVVVTLSAFNFVNSAARGTKTEAMFRQRCETGDVHMMSQREASACIAYLLRRQP